jgi:hypothetical protein
VVTITSIGPWANNSPTGVLRSTFSIRSIFNTWPGLQVKISMGTLPFEHSFSTDFGDGKTEYQVLNDLYKSFLIFLQEE